MPSFDIIKTSKYKKTFRTRHDGVMKQKVLNKMTFSYEFIGNINKDKTEINNG